MGFVGNTLSHKTVKMGQGGYGAIYNGQLEKTTTGTVSRWPQRGLYYRSGLLNCDFASDRTNSCDQKDFENDFLVVYRYTDKEGNSARPLMRKVVTRDTTPPSVKLIGDQTLENSAGSYVHSTASSNSAQCVQAQNRSAACDTTQTVDDKSSCETAGCIWSYEDADNYAAGQNGLFDTNRIITYFEHRDDCDKDIITTVSMYSGLCASGTRTKLTCTAGTECYAGIFQYRSSNAASDPDAYEQPSSTNNLMSSTDARMQAFPEWTAGDYSITYETMDSAGLKHSVCRQIENVDHTHPIIQILGSDVMTLEATHQGNYIDDGATCSDQVDGVISQNVEVSGDVVNLSKVGTCTITYNCKDSANNAAPAATRTVVGAVTGGNENDVVHEASFPYTDPGASCSDVIDGQVDTLCFTSWDPLPDSASHWPQHTTGAVTTVTTDQAALSASDWAGKAICTTIADPNDASCADKSYDECVNNATCRLNVFTACDSVNLIKTQTVNANGGSSVDGASVGTYTITYRAKNTVGLYNDGANCRGGAAHYFRQVSVQDTLRPVITLKYDGGIVAQGDVSPQDATTRDFTGVTHHSNEYFSDFAAGDTKGRHPSSLMSEDSSSSVNGWVIGAIASAVAGLALLGYSTRRTAVATSVPV